MFKTIAIAMLVASTSAVTLRVDPVKNTCVNINKATGVEEPCSTAGNSAWNTHTTSRTDDPRQAQATPYPAHTLH